MIKVMKQWYEKLFENYGNNYDNEPFTHGTAGENDIIDQVEFLKRLHMTQPNVQYR